MSNKKAFINLSGAMDLIKMSNNPLTPIYEAMTNSLEVLAQIKFIPEAHRGKLKPSFILLGVMPPKLDLGNFEVLPSWFLLMVTT